MEIAQRNYGFYFCLKIQGLMLILRYSTPHFLNAIISVFAFDRICDFLIFSTVKEMGLDFIT